MSEIRKIAVIGSGTMGAGIAAQVANAGLPVVLLDIVPAGAENRNLLAEGAVQRLLKTEPAAFMTPQAAKLVTTGNLDDHLALLADCDWIIEAVIERLDIKQALYRRIEAVRRPDAAISSNTSTIPLQALIEGLGDDFARSFMITHFFNPPRYMRLMELVTGPATDPALAERVARVSDIGLGKSVVRCPDSPGFIANRLGVYWLQAGVIAADELGLTVEEADAVFGKPMGVPKTGIFGLLDLIGLDLVPHITASLRHSLPADDPFGKVDRVLPVIEQMIAGGYTGRKGKGGFYRLNRSGGRKIKESIDLATGDYRAERVADLPELANATKDLRGLLTAPTPAGRFASRVLGATLAYAAMLVPEAAADIVAIDDAMRLGYNWRWGPFELIDRLGADWLIAHLEQADIAIPPLLRLAAGRSFYRVVDGRREALQRDGTYQPIVRPDGVLLLDDIKLASKPVLKNGSAALWDIGDGVLCLEFTSKSNSLDDQILKLVGETVALIGGSDGRYKALVIYNDGQNFSVGANLGLALFSANIAAWPTIEKLVSGGQMAYRALKYAPFPVVAAPAGMALGGGCEIVIQSDAVQAHAETYIGLVEVGVGLVPAWGGCAEMLARWAASPSLPKGPMPAAMKVFETVSTASVSKSAAEARELLYLRPSDGITMNRDRLLADAKAKALALARDYQPPCPQTLHLAGASGHAALVMAAEGFARRGIATPYDLVVADALARVLTGGEADPLDDVTEDALLALERREFMRLVRKPGTLARVETMLETGKPLRN